MGVFILLVLTPIVFFFARTFEGSFNPAKIFCYVWVFQIVLISFVFFPLLHLTYTGQIYILLCLICFLMGSCLGKCCYIKAAVVPAINLIDIRKLRTALVFLIVMGFVSTLHNILSHGFSISQIFNFNELLNMNHEMSVQRYSGTQEDRSFIGQLLGIFVSLCPLVGGFSFLLSDKKLSIFALIPSVCGALTSGAKMGVITAFALFISGVFVCSSVYHIKLKIKTRHIIYILGGVVLFFSILVLSMIFRIGAFNMRTLQIVSEKFIVYSLGNLPAFDNWFDSYIDSYNPDYTFGTQTFLGFFHYFGLANRVQGLYQESIRVSVEGGSTNVYTVFRTLVSDFGVVGATVWCLLMGMLTQVIYKCLCLNRSPKVCITLMMGVNFFTFWSFVTSVFVYTTYFALFIFFYLTMLVTKRK